MTTKEIKGSFLGSDRVYNFELMNSKNGVSFFHQYSFYTIDMLPHLMPFCQAIAKSLKGESIDFAINEDTVKALQVIKNFLTFEVVEEIAGKLLKGMTIEKEEPGEDENSKTIMVKYTADDDGFGDYCVGHPLEIYLALFYSIVANFPQFIPFIVALLDDVTGDTEQTTPTPEPTK